MGQTLLLILASFFSVMGFAILLNCPSKSIYFAGLSGATGWAVYYAAYNMSHSPILGVFLGAMMVGIMGEGFAIYLRRPATVYIIPGILPLVPGYGLYHTMLSIIENNNSKAAEVGVTALFTAVAIATGLIVASTIAKLIRNFTPFKISP